MLIMSSPGKCRILASGIAQNTGKFPTKFSCMFGSSFEHIFVCCDTPYISMDGSMLNSEQSFYWYFHWAARNSGFRAKDVRNFRTMTGEVESQRNRLFSEFPINMHFQVFRWSCPTIFPLGLNVPFKDFVGGSINYPKSIHSPEKYEGSLHSKQGTFHQISLTPNSTQCSPQKQYLQTAYYRQQKVKAPICPVRPISFGGTYRHGGKFADFYGLLCIACGYGLTLFLIPIGGYFIDRGTRLWGWGLIGLGLLGGLLATLSGIIGCLPWDWWRCLKDGQDHSEYQNSHSGDTVTQKLLTMPCFCNTVIAIGRANMTNVLPIEKQVAIVNALAEGSGIRQIERMTGVHRDTIMRLGVRVGQGCAGLSYKT